jgi:hypothetical protein
VKWLILAAVGNSVGAICCRFGLAFALMAGLSLVRSPGTAQTSRTVDLPVAIEIQAKQILNFDHLDSSRRRFGALEFRGGVALTSRFGEFGGISSIRMQPDGSAFIAATDRGWWLRGRITYDGKRPTGIAIPEMAAMLGPDGRTLKARGWYDTESIAQDGGFLYVGIERVNRILRFDYGRDGLLARGQPIEVPARMRTLPNNKGLEALEFVPRGQPLGGALIGIAERSLDREGNNQGFLIGGPRPGLFALKRSDDFDISDSALLPAGDMLVLERKFSWTTGLFIQMRRIAQGDLRPGALVNGPVLFEADLRQSIDNMEGVSVHRGPDGEIVVTMISDDNFSPLQRTVLLQFTLIGE